jgi:two-component system sensor kinase FixL
MTPLRPLDADDDAARILAAVLDSSDDAIIVTDIDGIVLSWNGAATRLFGFEPAEIVGRTVGLLLPDTHRGEQFATTARLRSGEGVQNHETVRRTKTGGLVDVSFTMMPIRSKDGGVVGAVRVARDIRSRKLGELAQRSSETRWRSVVESAVDGIIVIDERGRIEAFNAAAERLFGYAEAEVLGKNVSILMPSPYREEHDGYLARYAQTGARKIIGIGREVTGRRRDGTTFPLHLSVGEMVIGGERRFTGILHDLSERVAMEEQLREQTALARLGEMAAVLAHEVKNPLAAVRGAIEVIGQRLAAGSKDAGIVKEIIGRVDALNDLMKDLLLFARPPQVKPARIEVRSLITSTADLLGKDPALSAVHVAVEGSPAQVIGDPGLLRIVFLNLMVNSAHAMRGEGAITVSVAQADQGCRIAFTDSGPGIPPDVRDKIFVPFFTTKARGSGLGLPTAKRLVEAHRGTIAVECPPAGGTTVTIQLPASS